MRTPAVPAALAVDAQPLFDAAHWIAWSAPYLAALTLIAGIVWVCVVRRRTTRVEEALADRVTVEVVPTSTFDPSDSVIGRWAQHLARVRYAAAGTPPGGAGVRLRYTAHEGRMRCLIEGPAAAGAVLTMPGFADVEVRAAGARPSSHSVRFPRQEAGR